MQVTFVIPPETHSIESSVAKKLEGGKGFYPKLGLLYVAAYLEKHTGTRPTLIDCPPTGMDYPELEARLLTDRPDVVGISVLTFNLLDTMRTARLIKRVLPKTKVVLGGTHINLYPRESLGLKEVDYVVFGDGERVFTKLVELIDGKAPAESFDALGGLGWKRDDGELRLNHQRDTIETLNDLPFPARHLVDLDSYSHMIGKGERIATIQSSRGCPAACTFCDIRKTKFRYRSPENVVAEMRLLAERGVDDFFFVDDTITVNRKRVHEICNAITRSGLKINFKISARVDTVNQELLNHFAEAGCYRIHFGVESGSNRILEVMEKGVDTARIERAFRETRAAGMGALAYMMIGVPGETREEMMQTIDFAIKLDPEYAQFSICTPYPKTELYHRMLKSGDIPYDYWQGFAENPTEDFRVKFFNPNFAYEELREIQDLAHRRFYGRFRVMMREVSRLRGVGDLVGKAKLGANILFGRLNA